ncbi:FAD binding domain-containing protein [Aminiphilus circumscriptus]|uniref:FAD binding domain-containing protein n=1 Tax=Aminiphilus circumscriptus TaxID=290732 RepID=UPI000492C8B7|nr:FAD binding domain-containing protein [Aminiphilus circumscriptus]
MRISLLVNGTEQMLRVPPLRSLLKILREDLGLTGTKEGCGEGECGACAVFLDGMLVNSCLVPAFQLHGREVVTIEGLGSKENPDPLQNAFLEEGAVQCGFCTPGLILASRALLNENPHPNREEIRAGLSGSLCRCTGYERVVAAVEKCAAASPEEATTPDGQGTREKRGFRSDGPPFPCDGDSPRVLFPQSIDETLRMLADADAPPTLFAGGTDLMVPGNGEAVPECILNILDIPDLRGIFEREDLLEIRAGTSMDAVAKNAVVRKSFPALAEAALSFGAPAIRNRATIGGNLAGASTAADSPPALLVLGASVVLESVRGTRTIPLEEFVTSYRKTVLAGDELLTKILVPFRMGREQAERYRNFQSFRKVGSRSALTISRVTVAASLDTDAEGRIVHARIAVGSAAPTVRLLERTGRFLLGRTADAATRREACRRAAEEVAPRSTPEYKRWVVEQLLGDFLEHLPGGPRCDEDGAEKR